MRAAIFTTNIVDEVDMTELSLGDRELDVMGVLWEIGSGTVAEVREQLPADLAYTTVLTILRNLEEKGFVTHETEGRAHRYLPCVAQQSARRTALARLINTLFHGSPEQLLAHMVADRTLSADDLRRIRRQLDAKIGDPKVNAAGGKPKVSPG
jgi:BlaI family penicillinase repressor